MKLKEKEDKIKKKAEEKEKKKAVVVKQKTDRRLRLLLQVYSCLFLSCLLFVCLFVFFTVHVPLSLCEVQLLKL